VLWETPWNGSSNSTASASQTIQVADDRLLVSKGYSGGAQLLSIKHEAAKTGGEGESKLQGNGEWTIEKVWQNHGVLKTKQNNVIVKDDCIYGLSDGLMQCVDLKTGKLRWRGADYGHGQLLRIGDVLLVLTEEGEAALVEFNPAKFVELAKIQAIRDKTWNNPALSGNLLVIRNTKEAACYELPLAR
jgi:outer membrane protein assembly factor BamB